MSAWETLLSLVSCHVQPGKEDVQADYFKLVCLSGTVSAWHKWGQQPRLYICSAFKHNLEIAISFGL